MEEFLYTKLTCVKVTKVKVIVKGGVKVSFIFPYDAFKFGPIRTDWNPNEIKFSKNWK